MRTDMMDVVERLRVYVEAEDYAGYDPYDALNSPAIKWLSSRSKWARLVSTQVLRICPVNLRPLLGINKAHNPKAIGLFLGAYVNLCRVNRKPAYIETIQYLLELLEELRSNGYSGNCWGYNFDWQSKTFFRPKGTPTIVNTAFIGHALLDCYEQLGVQKALAMAVSIKAFILNDLYRTRHGDTFCFSYTPVDTGVVHNANMLGASLLIRLFKYCGDSACRDDGLASLAYSMDHQHEDGSWYYADTDVQKWIDSFHTGFNLQALRAILEEGLAGEYREAYHRGVDYYAKNFFLADGTPKYYNDRVYPIDIHAPAEAISFFSQVGDPYKSLTDSVLTWMLDKMQSPKGYFYFRKTRYFINRIPYMRWSQAWVLYALTQYLCARCIAGDSEETIGPVRDLDAPIRNVKDQG
jgi:hypothetical protein